MNILVKTILTGIITGLAYETLKKLFDFIN
jgi:hypothetical protein